MTCPQCQTPLTITGGSKSVHVGNVWRYRCELGHVHYGKFGKLLDMDRIKRDGLGRVSYAEDE